jgi:hypothetical protein
MRWLRSVGREVLGLFVDDGNYAGAILLWVGLAIAVLPRLGLGAWDGPVLLAGLAAILVESALRFAGRPK